MSLLELMIRRVGFRRAVTLGSFIFKWGLWRDSDPDADEDVEAFAEFALLSRSQAFRQRQWFREAFPEWESPTDLWNAVQSQVAERNARDDAALAQVLTARLAT